MDQVRSSFVFLLIAIFCLLASQAQARSKPHPPKKGGGVCKPFGFLQGPPVTSRTPAILTVNDFESGGDGGFPSACDGKFHKNSDLVVALSTGWFNHRRTCGRSVVISANGRQVTARVVDECDTVNGCDAEHGFQPPCPPNVVDGSPAVWKALGISQKSDKYGSMDVTWTPAGH